MPNIRGKTLIKDFESLPKLEQLPNWGFDGSSTQQAEGHNSDCVLKPVASYPDPAVKNGVIVLCEVMHADMTPHSTNEQGPRFWMIRRRGLVSSRNTFSTRMDSRWDSRRKVFPRKDRGRYYCGVGYSLMGSIAREIVNKHLGNLSLKPASTMGRHQR